MINNLDLGAAFDKWKDESFIPYRGVLLEKSGSGYKCMGIFCLSMRDVDRVLESGRSALQKSVNRK
jgi:hypothetical protein